jgi:dipeptidyl aminopeptidase/acylaminoacyl peptidase
MLHRHSIAIGVAAILLWSCSGKAGKSPSPQAEPAIDLLTARAGFVSKLLPPTPWRFDPVDIPPAEVYNVIRYRSPAGELVAYISPDPGDGRKHPAVLWAHGGFYGVGSHLWETQPASNDQTPNAFRKAGFVVMLPSWRGENANPGRMELFYGEVDDALAAASYLSNVPYIDPSRMYMVGHSTGATITLLAAEAGAKLRAAFAFGGAPDLYPVVSDGKGYSQKTPYDYRDKQESYVRSPIHFVETLKTPTWYFEGEDSMYVSDALEMQRRAQRAGVPFATFIVAGGNHVNILHPLTALLAERIAQDIGPSCAIRITKRDVATAFASR